MPLSQIGVKVILFPDPTDTELDATLRFDEYYIVIPSLSSQDYRSVGFLVPGAGIAFGINARLALYQEFALKMSGSAMRFRGNEALQNMSWLFYLDPRARELRGKELEIWEFKP